MKLITRIAAVAAVCVLPLSASATPDKGKAAPKCPACKMAVSTKKSKANPTAVKINGKTYYCCDKCDMGKKPAKKP